MCVRAGLSLVVGLVLYISSINDEVMNRPREPEHFFNYYYGWSFAFAASSFLLKEVSLCVCVFDFFGVRCWVGGVGWWTHFSLWFSRSFLLPPNPFFCL